MLVNIRCRGCGNTIFPGAASAFGDAITTALTDESCELCGGKLMEIHLHAKGMEHHLGRPVPGKRGVVV